MSPIRMEKIESAIRVALEFNAAFNRHDIAGMASLISGDCVFEDFAPAPDGAVYSGRDAIVQFWREFFREAQHAQLEIEEIFGTGKRCILRWTYRWTDAAGNQNHARGVDIFLVKEGLISEKLSYVKG